MLRFSAARSTVIAAGFASLFMSGCGGGGTANFNAPPLGTVGTPAICTPINGVSIGQVYPASGTQNAPFSPLHVVIAASGALQPTAYIILVPNGASPTSGNTNFGPLVAITPFEVPPGSTSTNIPNPTYYESTDQFATLFPANTNVAVYFGDSGANCLASLVPGGSFKIQ